MKLLIILSLFFLSTNSWSSGKHRHKKKHNHSAHVHGLVKLEIATDKRQILVMLKSPAESFLGFEYKAKTKAERKKVQAVKEAWKKELVSYLGESQLKDCRVTKTKWDQEFEGKSHSRIIAEAYIACEKEARNRTLHVTLSKTYKKIQKIHLQLLREDGSVLNKKYKSDFKVKI